MTNQYNLLSKLLVCLFICQIFIVQGQTPENTGWSSNSSIVINELMASNDAAVSDNAGDFDDWIELYNKSSVSVDLTGWYITDKPDNLTKYDIPVGTTIDANDYLIIWADEDSSQGPVPVHANFKLASAGETVILLDEFVLVVDSVTFGQQTTDLGYARVPNGTGNFVIQQHTFNANNNTVSTNSIEAENAFNIFPNPTKGQFNISIENNYDELLFEVFDTQGRKVEEFNVNTAQFQIDASSWSSGLYILRYGQTSKKLLILK